MSQEIILHAQGSSCHIKVLFVHCATRSSGLIRHMVRHVMVRNRNRARVRVGIPLEIYRSACDTTDRVIQRDLREHRD